MEAALNLRTGATVGVDLYGQLESEARDRMELVCPGVLESSGAPCRAPAHYRRRTSDGRRPCFFAKHYPGCERRAEPSVDAPGDSGRPTHQRADSARRLQINLERPRPTHGPDGRHQPDEAQPGRTTLRHVQPSVPGQVGRARTRLRLNTILGTLVHDAKVLDPRMVVEVEGFPEIPAGAFFVAMEDTSPQTHASALRGYYGLVRKVTDAASEGSVFLYVEGPTAPSLKVLLTREQLAAVRLARPETLLGQYVLALGEYRLTSGGQRAYIAVHEPGGVVAFVWQAASEAVGRPVSAGGGQGAGAAARCDRRPPGAASTAAPGRCSPRSAA